MSHLLETFANGRTAFVSARVDAWHRLGLVTASALTVEEALESALLSGWNVRKVALQTEAVMDANGAGSLPVMNHYATVRTNPVTKGTDVLGVVGKKYHPIQNEQHALLLNTLVDMSGAHFETAGSLRGGREVFVTMKMPDHMKVGGVDNVDLYLAALNSHDGSSAFRLLVTPVRIVCANTQAAALKSAKSSFAIRHTSGANAAIAQARQALGLTFTYQKAFEEEAERMIQQSMTDREFMSIMGRLFPEPGEGNQLAVRRYQEKMNTLENLFTTAPTNEAIRGTRWAGYQSLTEYIDHYAPAQRTQWTNDLDTARAMRSLGVDAVATKEAAFRLINA